MIPQEPNRHDKAADAVHEGRPVDAEYTRGARRNPRILVILALSTAAAAILLIGMWMVSNNGFSAQNPTPTEKAVDAQAFQGDGDTPPAADAPTDATGRAAPVPAGETPNVNTPTTPSN